MATSASASASAPAPASTHQHLHSLQLLRQLLSLSQLNHINTPPSNSPTLSLPSSLSLRAAINSLLTNRCLSAPLIDPNSSRLIGTFSLADALHFICLLHPPQNHALISRPSLNPSPLQVSIPSDPSLFSLPLSTLTDLRPCSPPHSFHLNSDSTLLEAAQQLSRSHLSRLPIVDRDRLSGNDSLSSILSPLTLLRYISTHPAADIDRLSQSIGSLRIGSYLSNTQFPRSLTTPIQIESHSLLAATEQHCLRDIARILLDRAVGAVPIVDQEGSMVDIYELVDLVDLLASPKPPQHPFDLTVHQALSLRTRKVTGITFCSSKDSLGSLLKYLAKNTVHLFVMVENVEGGEPLTGRPSRTRKASKRSKTVKDRLVGVLSLGDILDHLISFQSGHHCAPYDTASATQPLPIVSANTSTYSSSLVSCSSNTSSVSFFSPTTTLHSTSAPNHSSMPARTHASHLHTPLSLRIASYPSSLTQPLLDTSHVSSTHLTNQPSWSAGPCLAASSRQSPNASYRSICKHPPVPATYHLPASRTSTELRTPDQTPSPSVVPVRPPPPPMNKIAEFAAQMMCYLWFAEPLSLQRTSSVAQSLRLNEDRLSRFGGSGAAADGDDHGTQIGRAAAAASGTGTSITQAQLVPNPEFVMFIHNLLSTTQVSHSVVLLALFYIHRLKCLNPIKPNSKSEYRIGVVSLMLANKMLDDHTYTAKTWSEVSRLPLISLNDGEIEFLQGLDFELHVNIRDFSAWFRLLHGMVNLKDHHTALVLASGPRTRWFKKMRVASGEGLSVLEGLVSPLRESKIMKGEAEKERQGAASANRPSHPYNLRRAARVSSTTAAGPVARPTRGAVQQIASWGNTVYDRGMSYGASVAVTPQQQVEFGERQIASMPTKSRSTMHQPTRPSRMNMGSKRSASEYLEQEVDGPARKRVASALVAMPSVPMPAPVHSTRLPPIMLAQPGHSGTYLGTAIVPCSQNGALGGGNGGGAELYFRTLAAGRRGTGHGAEAARQGQVVCQAPQQQEGAAGVFVFGSEPWRRQQQGQDQGQGGDEWRWYSNFSNAGVPGVVWADMSRANLSGAGGQQVQTVRQQQQQVQHTRQQQQLLHHHHHHHQQLQQHLQQQQQQQQQQQVQIASIGNDSTRRTTGVGQSQVQRGY